MRRTHQLLRTVGRLARSIRPVSRYDLVLGLIPVAFGAAGAAGAFLSVTATTTVSVAAILSGLAVVDALFLNPPRDPSSGRPPA